MNARNERGFSIIELMLVVVLVAIIAMLAYPSYKSYIVRTAREAAESQLQQLANLQEKVFLNSNTYTKVGGAYDATNNITTPYNGTNTGGLGLSPNVIVDGKYTVTLSVLTDNTFTLLATPVVGTLQEGDGTITIDHLGNRIWNKPSGVQSW